MSSTTKTKPATKKPATKPASKPAAKAKGEPKAKAQPKTKGKPETKPEAAPVPATTPVAAADAAVATDAPATPAKAKRAPKAKPEPKDKPLSCLGAAVAVLKANGDPMTCKDMIATMAGKGLWSSTAPTPHATLYAAVIREIATKGDKARFRKTSPGHFALADHAR